MWGDDPSDTAQRPGGGRSYPAPANTVALGEAGALAAGGLGSGPPTPSM